MSGENRLESSIRFMRAPDGGVLLISDDPRPVLWFSTLHETVVADIIAAKALCDVESGLRRAGVRAEDARRLVHSTASVLTRCGYLGNRDAENAKWWESKRLANFLERLADRMLKAFRSLGVRESEPSPISWRSGCASTITLVIMILAVAAQGGNFFAGLLHPFGWLGVALVTPLYIALHEFSHVLVNRAAGVPIDAVGVKWGRGLGIYVRAKLLALSTVERWHFWTPFAGVCTDGIVLAALAGGAALSAGAPQLQAAMQGGIVVVLPCALGNLKVTGGADFARALAALGPCRASARVNQARRCGTVLALIYGSLGLCGALLLLRTALG